VAIVPSLSLNSNSNSLIGSTLYQNPFVFYNVIAGNLGNGVSITNSNNVTVQANFLGMGADNETSVPNRGNGLLVAGSSQNTQVGGVIPLGNVISGNTLNGILVRDTVSGFISFNTFGGIAAFRDSASPNGLDGILITSTGGNNTVRTCIISGNNGNGIEIGGNATGVQITDTSMGLNTEISGAIPNLGSGIVIRGEAHNNAIGGFQPSIEPNVFASGNKVALVSIASAVFPDDALYPARAEPRPTAIFSIIILLLSIFHR
jgi:trimeric autotransporter adhesin